PRALAELARGGQRPREPIVRELGHAGTTRAGLPSTVAPAGTSRATTAPAPSLAPAPTSTPFNTIAPIPIQAPSPMRTGRLSTGGRPVGSPYGALATASRRRSAGSRGWKSESAIVTW